ncbi:MAG: hypothetical protein ACR2NP_17160 [Pirellulaceae bacterium]
MIEFACTACEETLDVESNRAGVAVECPDCGEKTTVPQGKTEPSSHRRNAADSRLSKAAATISATDYSAIGHSLLSKIKEALALTRLFCLRFASSDFQQMKLTDFEAAKLANEASISRDSEAARVHVWRRALLWISSACLIFASITATVNFLESLSQQNPGIIALMSLLQFAANIAGAVFVFRAARHWSDISTSRRLSRIGWLYMFIAPFLIACIPVAPFMGQQTGLTTAEMSAGFGMTLAIGLVPIIIGLFPGLIRASLAVKTLFPELTLPGWVVVVIAPLYSLFFMLPLVFAMQSITPGISSLLAIIGCSALVLGPVFLVFDAPRIVAPMALEDVDRKLGPTRRKVKLAGAIAIGAFILLLLINMPSIPVAVFNVGGFLASVLASILLTVVVFSDFLVNMLRYGFVFDRTVFELESANVVADRFERLGDVAIAHEQSAEHRMLGEFPQI